MKKVLCVLMSLTLLTAFTGCADARNTFYGDSEPKTDTAAHTDETKDITKNYDLTIPDYSKYYKLGQHSGLKYYINDADYEVNDATIDSMLLSELEISPQTANRPAKNGDYLNISIIGTIDGKEFDGGSVENSDIILGKHTIMSEIETALDGMSAGESTTVNYTFPNDYADTKLIGKTAEFKVTVNSVNAYDLSLLTDELVAEKTEYKTVSEYKAAVHDEIENNLADLKKTDSASILMSLVLKNSEVTGYDSAQVDDMIESAKYATRTYAGQQGIEVDEYCQNQYGKTYDEYVEGLKDTAHEYLDSIMTICEIARAEGIKVTDEEYQNQIQIYKDKYGLTTEGIAQAYTSQDIVNSILILKIQDWLLANNTKSATPIDYN